jgi:SAM-dependent methyltransferase
MNFINLVDIVQVFANEYCNPKSLILVIGATKDSFFIRNIFKFISSDVIIVDNIKSEEVDIVINNYFPFEDSSFDLIIKFKNLNNNLNEIIFKYLKPNGKILINENVIDCLEKYYIKNEVFSVL